MTTRPSRSLKPTKRTRYLGIVVAIAIAAIQILPRLNEVYVDWTWFESVSASSVLWKTLGVRVGLFCAVAIFVAASAALGLLLAVRSRPPFAPTNNPALKRYQDLITSNARVALLWVPLAIGVLSGLVAASNWQELLLFVNSQEFGSVDPQFGKDLGFYAFELPFIRSIIGWALFALGCALVTNIVGHYLLGGIQLGRKSGLLTSAARVQIAVLAGLFVLAKAVSYWFDRYELLGKVNDTFAGAGYTDINAVLPAKLFLFTVALVCAIAFFIAVLLKDLRIPALAAVLLVLSGIIAGGLWPMLVEQFSVKPNRADKEYEYIARNIDATRQAYGLGEDNVVVKENWGAVNPDPKKAAKDTATLTNIRVLDPNILSATFTQQQQLRNFYGFPSMLNMDRYQVDGELRDFVVAARELNPLTLRENQRDWVNKHTVYTHGNGFIAAPANRVNEIATDAGSDRGGFPVYQVSDLEAIENKRKMTIPVTQPRVYFGPLISQMDSDYAIVGNSSEGPREYDTDTTKYTYTGTGGSAVSTLLARTAFALHFGERNILFSSLIGENSRILFERDPRERVQKVAPWLTVDSTTYPAVIDGRITWIVDGYTTLDSLPYSQPTVLGGAQSLVGVNPAFMPSDAKKVAYVRNSVKATVDAYDGTVTLYAFDNDDPVLKAWRQAFPDIVQPKEAMQAELTEHVRYPEDLFNIQREILAKYHVDDPRVFFNNDSFWSVPEDPTQREFVPATGTTADAADTSGPDQPPYYVLASDPETRKPSFQLISAYRGFKREYLAAHMAVSSDPQTYGRITIREQRATDPLPMGPRQAQDLLFSAAAVAQDRKLFEGTAKITDGNLLALPLADDSVLYVEPMYTQRKGQETAFPKLLRVLVTYNRSVGYAPTLHEALKQVGINTDPSKTKTSENEPEQASVQKKPEEKPEATTPVPAPPVSDMSSAVSGLGNALDKVRSAQQSGDFSDYGQALENLQSAVDAYQRLEQAQGN